MTIHRYARKAYKHQLNNDFKENKYLPQTVDGLLDYLFDEDSYTGYIVYIDKEDYDKSTIGQRLNRLWVVPVCLVCAPFQWMFTGKTGLSQHSNLGSWVAKITGL